MLRHDTSRRDLISIIELLTALVTSGLDPDTVMKEVVERAAFLTGAAGAMVEMAEEGEMICHAVWGTATHLRGVPLKRTGTLSGLCMELGVPLNSVDTATDPRVDHEVCDRIGARSVVCVPLSRAAQTVGVLKAFSPHPGAFAESDLEALRLLATVIASSLSHAEPSGRPESERYHDSLTALRNRRAYDEELAAEISRARRYERSLALALVDLNGFRAVNERYGHPAGDEALRRTAAKLRRSMRQADRCYRVGGDEFAIVLPETRREEAALIIKRLLREVQEPTLGITACAGLAELNGWSRAAELHRAADEALFAEKKAWYESSGTMSEA